MSVDLQRSLSDHNNKRRRPGWGITDHSDRSCCNCGNCKQASCGHFRYWYAEYDTDTNYHEVTLQPLKEGWGWDSGLVVVDGVALRFRHLHSRTAPTTMVLGIDSMPIGKVVRRVLFSPCTDDDTWLEAFDNSGTRVYRVLMPPGCRCWRCLTCCGNMELDYDVVRGGGEAPPQEVVATLTTRVHACRPCYSWWFGFPVWPEGATENEKALLMGLAHALTPGPVMFRNGDNPTMQ